VSEDAAGLDGLVIAQLSDTHLFEDPGAELWGASPDEGLDDTIEMLRARTHHPNFALVSGDCSADGSLESYRRLAGKMKRLGCPTYYVPGNHDDYEVLASELALEPSISIPGKLVQVFEAGGWRFLLLDSSIAGSDGGKLGDTQLDWLAGALALEPDMSTLVFLHHPPVSVDSPWLDAMMLADGPKLVELIDRSPQVAAVLFGHVHQEFESKRAGTRYLAAPSTFFQFAPRAAEFAGDGSPPGARVIELTAGRLETSVARVRGSL